MIRRLALGALCASLLTAAIAAPTAQGAGPANHPFLFEISQFEPKPKQVEYLEDPCGVAVDSSGDIFVSNYYRDQVDVFSSSGFYLTRILLDEEPIDGPCALAVDAAGDLYVDNFHRGVVKFTPAEFGTPDGLTAHGPGTVIDPGHSTGLALDPATGDLYIDERTYVAVYEAADLFQAEPEPARKIGLGTLGAGYGVAVSDFPATAGDVYVPDAATGTVKVYDPAVSTEDPKAVIDGLGTPQAGFDDLTDSAVAVDPSNGHLHVVDNTQPGFEHPAAVVDEFSIFGNYRGQLPHAITDSEPPGLAVDSAGDVYVTGGNDEGAALYAFGPAAPPGPSKVLTIAKPGSGAGSVTSSPTEIDCGNTCSGEFAAGAEVTLTAAPSERSTFTGFSGGGCAGAGPCEVTLGEDTAVSAEFAPIPQETLSVAKSGAGAGAVSGSSPGAEFSAIDCGATCSASYNEGTTLTLTAAPSERSTFTGFSGGGCSGAGPCQVTLGEDTALSAEFAPIPQETLSVAKKGSGAGTVSGSSPGPEFSAIDCGGTCAATYNQGATVTLTALAASGSTFTGFSGGGCSGTGPCQVSLGEETKVGAQFEAIPLLPPILETTAGSKGALPQGPLPGPPARLALGRLAVRGATATLKAIVPGPGTLSASGSGLRAAVAHPGAARTVTLHLALSGAGKQALEKAKHRKLEVKVTVTFTPSGGGATATATKAAIFREKGRGH